MATSKIHNGFGTPWSAMTHVCKQDEIQCFGMRFLAGSAPAAIPSLAAAPNRTRRLQDWVNRELQALLDQQDVSIVRSFVMSLAGIHGLDQHQPNGLNRDASARSENAIIALQPFLHDRTEHFWHELKYVPLNLTAGTADCICVWH